MGNEDASRFWPQRKSLQVLLGERHMCRGFYTLYLVQRILHTLSSYSPTNIPKEGMLFPSLQHVRKFRFRYW